MDTQEVSKLILQPLRRVVGAALVLVPLVAATATVLGYPWGGRFLFALSILGSLGLAAYLLLKAFAFHARSARAQRLPGQTNDALYSQLMLLVHSLGPALRQEAMEIASTRVIADRTLSVQHVRTGPGWVQLRLDAGAVDGLWQEAKLHVCYEDGNAHVDVGTWPAQVRREVTFVVAQVDSSTLQKIQPMRPPDFKIRVIEPQPSHDAVDLLADLLSQVEKARMLPDRSGDAPDGGAIRGLRIGWLRLLVVPRDSFDGGHGSAEIGRHEVVRDQQSGQPAR